MKNIIILYLLFSVILSCKGQDKMKIRRQKQQRTMQNVKGNIQLEKN